MFFKEFTLLEYDVVCEGTSSILRNSLVHLPESHPEKGDNPFNSSLTEAYGALRSVVREIREERRGRRSSASIDDDDLPFLFFYTLLSLCRAQVYNGDYFHEEGKGVHSSLIELAKEHALSKEDILKNKMKCDLVTPKIITGKFNFIKQKVYRNDPNYDIRDRMHFKFVEGKAAVKEHFGDWNSWEAKYKGCEALLLPFPASPHKQKRTSEMHCSGFRSEV